MKPFARNPHHLPRTLWRWQYYPREFGLKIKPPLRLSSLRVVVLWLCFPWRSAWQSTGA